MNDSEVVSWSERIDDMSIRRIEEEEARRSKRPIAAKYSNRSCVSKASDWICCVGCFDF